jgi:tetratricopeptide (TPR) repeat protein
MPYLMTGDIRLLTGALALLAAYAGASAQSHQDWQPCQGQDADAAIFACTKLIGGGQLKGPDLGAAYYHRGAAHLSEGEIDDAIDDLSEAVRGKPDFAEALFDRARALGRKGEFDRSIADYNEVIRLQPDNVDAFNNRGRAYRDEGDLDRAVADLSEAIRLNPNYVLAFGNRGLTYLVRGTTITRSPTTPRRSD